MSLDGRRWFVFVGVSKFFCVCSVEKFRIVGGDRCWLVLVLLVAAC